MDRLLWLYVLLSMPLALETETRDLGVQEVFPTSHMASLKAHGSTSLPIRRICQCLFLRENTEPYFTCLLNKYWGQKVLKGRQNKSTLKRSLPTRGHLSHPWEPLPSPKSGRAAPSGEALDLICFTSKPLPVSHILWYRHRFSPGKPCFLSKYSSH